MPIHKWKAVALVLVSLGAAVLFTVPERTRLQMLGPVRAEKVNARKVYPYSVIPGGAASGGELRQALLRDRIAASHYAGFLLEQARVETLPKSRNVFVSYRIADRIYWSRNRLQLRKGETILTDGVSSARTRCGNRISDTPQLPVNGLHEPPADVLNSEAPDTPQATGDWSQAVPEESASRAEKLAGIATSSGDFLSRFGPASLGWSTGLGNGSGSPNTARNSKDGATERNPSRDTGSGKSPSLATNETSSFGVAGKGTTLVMDGAAPLETMPALSAHPDLFFPAVPLRNYAPLQSEEELPVIAASTGNGANTSSAVGSHQLARRTEWQILTGPASPLMTPTHPLNSAVQTPEPRTVFLTACGFALLCYRVLRNHLKARRALR